MPTYQKVWKVNGAIIRQRGCSYQVETHHNGKRARQTFRTVEEAEQYAKQVKIEIRTEGDLALAIKGAQRIEALRLLDAFPTKKEQDDAVSAARLLTAQVRDYNRSKPLLAEAERMVASESIAILRSTRNAPGRAHAAAVSAAMIWISTCAWLTRAPRRVAPRAPSRRSDRS